MCLDILLINHVCSFVLRSFGYTASFSINSCNFGNFSGPSEPGTSAAYSTAAEEHQKDIPEAQEHQEPLGISPLEKYRPLKPDIFKKHEGWTKAQQPGPPPPGMELFEESRRL